MDEVKVSKLMSLALRHKPEVLGLTLDKEGWASVLCLQEGLTHAYGTLSLEDLEHVVATNSKKRFEFNEDHTLIRACQGHSVEVELNLLKEIPPTVLYHGTVKESLESILQEGLKPMSRHAVHLSKDLETARIVANRRKKEVVILEVDAQAMHAAGFEFEVSTNGVWLTSKVPSQYLKVGYSV